jgi:aspartyl-tRNA synthetase
MSERTNIGQLAAKVGEIVLIKGWVHTWRALGKISFLDLRDRSGIVQVVLLPDELDAASQEIATDARNEWVLAIEGEVQSRKGKGDEPLSNVEIKAKRIEILSRAETPPVDISSDERLASEEIRLKYRYLDLRRPKMQAHLKLRHEVIKFIRQWLSQRDFWEVETPFLSKSTPEGARDFLVPSRKQKGSFYALPQSPQQYKQLLMVAGVEKYFQIVRCFRDEDQRGDRQPEFTQLDMEMSFITQEDVLQLTEQLMTELVTNVTPHLHLSATPFVRMTYAEAMAKYQSDKPDLRQDKNDPTELAFAWITDFPMFEKLQDGSWSAVHHPFTAIQNPADLERAPAADIPAQQYDLVLNGFEVGGGSIREHRPENLSRVFQALGHSKEAITAQFGHLLTAFKYGVPPHGGIAPGVDRLVMVLAGEPNIREVMAFPKTSDSRDLMMDAPSSVDKNQLNELGIQLK